MEKVERGLMPMEEFEKMIADRKQQLIDDLNNGIVHLSTYQAVSGAGLAAINELKADTEANLKGKKFENKCFKKPISFNVIPQIDVFCEKGYTKEEMKVVNET